MGERQALLRGLRPVDGLVQEPLRIHELRQFEKDGAVRLWMSDLPEELNQCAEMLARIRPSGRVLIGGLGLGIWAAMTAQYPSVESVTVVERSQDVIRLCARHALYRTVRGNIATFLNTTTETFDAYLLDTWTGTSESTWWTEVFPLRRIIRRRHGWAPEIHCWAEDMMWGQIYRQLTNCTQPHWHYSYLPLPMTPDKAEEFLNMVGTPWWEKQYGRAVDRYFNELKARRGTTRRRRTKEVT